MAICKKWSIWAPTRGKTEALPTGKISFLLMQEDFQLNQHGLLDVNQHLKYLIYTNKTMSRFKKYKNLRATSTMRNGAEDICQIYIY